MVAGEFVPAAGGCDAAIALLLEGAPGWETYVPQYTQPWTQRGIVELDHKPVVDPALVQEREVC